MMIKELSLKIDRNSNNMDWLYWQNIDFKSEKPQTLTEYNKDLEKGDAEIEQGKFTTATDLKSEASKW